DSTWSYIISQRSTFTATSLIRICWPAVGLPICASSPSLIELANLPAFVRRSRSANDSRRLNAPMRRFLRLAIEGRRWRAERSSSIIARQRAGNHVGDFEISKGMIVCRSEELMSNVYYKKAWFKRFSAIWAEFALHEIT